jgi:hypothetical protein
MIKVSLNEVMGDDPNSPFWQYMSNNPEFKKVEQDIGYMIEQSRKHGVPFKDIDPKDLDQYDWKFK